jgi:hypothetical protein
MNKEISNINSKGEYHGYQTRYLIGIKDTLLVRTNMRNNKIIGYHEYHVDNKQTTYYHIR